LPLLLLLLSPVAHAGASRNAWPRALVHARAIARGALVEGPKHSMHAIAKRPVRYAGMLLAIGGLGAGAKLMHVDATPIAISLSTLATGWSAWKAIPALRESRGAARSRLVGRDLVWPISLSAGTTMLGTMDHSAASQAVTSKQLAKAAAKAGVQSAVIGSDVPTIVQTILDDKK